MRMLNISTLHTRCPTPLQELAHFPTLCAHDREIGRQRDSLGESGMSERILIQHGTASVSERPPQHASRSLTLAVPCRGLPLTTPCVAPVRCYSIGEPAI